MGESGHFSGLHPDLLLRLYFNCQRQCWQSYCQRASLIVGVLNQLSLAAKLSPCCSSFVISEGAPQTPLQVKRQIFFTYSWCAFRDLDLEESGLWQGSFWVSDAGIICFVYTEINMSTSNLCKPFSRSIVGKHIVHSCTIFFCCLDDPYRDPNMNRVG